MDAKKINESHRQFFHNGIAGLFDADGEPEKPVAASFRSFPASCPCGCGLENDVCEGYQPEAKADDDLPF